jgi:hypothetical protein
MKVMPVTYKIDDDDVYATEYITLLLPLNLPSAPSFLQNVSQKTLPPGQAESKSSLKKEHLWRLRESNAILASRPARGIATGVKV